MFEVMPELRPEIAALRAYEVGRPIAEVAREMGFDPSDIVRLTANETPFGPFPGVIEAAAEAVGRSSRYPDNSLWDLSHALADELGVERANLLFGNGSVALLVDMVNAVGGPGTNVVYGWPSFIMYRFAAIWAGSAHREVPLDDSWVFDPAAIEAHIDRDTRVVFICNPNNPTGTILDGDSVKDLVQRVPPQALVVIDEAYAEFVTDGRFRTAIPLALEMDNVVVLRTFSKIYGLAGHRIGYAIGSEGTITELRKAQPPLTVNTVAQAAALASLGNSDELQRRVMANREERHLLTEALGERGLDYAESHANFLFFEMPWSDSSEISEMFTQRGVIIRPMSGGWMRVTVGAEHENQRFIEALDGVLSDLPG
jgi:histidinol-phosphate aminotransferase